MGENEIRERLAALRTDILEQIGSPARAIPDETAAHYIDILDRVLYLIGKARPEPEISAAAPVIPIRQAPADLTGLSLVAQILQDCANYTGEISGLLTEADE